MCIFSTIFKSIYLHKTKTLIAQKTFYSDHFFDAMQACNEKCHP